MFLSRIELSPEAASIASFWREVAAPGGAHHALWRLFRRSAEQRRDFLFRSEDAGRGRVLFHVLSESAPAGDGDGLWRIESKPLAPRLATGDRLRFRLRASPTVKRAPAKGAPGKRHDVVMNARAGHAGDPDAFDVVRAAEAEGTRWLQRQATSAGFELASGPVEIVGEGGLIEEVDRPTIRVDGYRQHRLQRKGESPIRYSTLELEGVLVVNDPARFLAKLTLGFGPQKAFGCGLMLLQRA